MSKTANILAIILALALLTGCALGRKQWPTAQKSQDRFTLKLMEGYRQDNTLFLVVAVNGADNRLWRASIEYEEVGSEPGQGCIGCPFMVQKAVHVTRDQQAFDLKNHILRLSLPGLKPGVEYRFRVAGKSELAAMPLVYTDVYTSEP